MNPYKESWIDSPRPFLKVLSFGVATAVFLGIGFSVITSTREPTAESPPAAVESRPFVVATATASVTETATPEPTPTPTSTPEPLPTPLPLRFLPRDLVQVLESYPWPVEEALRVIYGPTPPNPQAPLGCANGESGGEHAVINASGHVGLFQVNVAVHRQKVERVVGRPLTLAEATDELIQPGTNVAVAYLIYHESGGDTWLHWSCRP